MKIVIITALKSKDHSLLETHHEKTCFFAYAKTKTQISCTVTVQLISTIVSAI